MRGLALRVGIIALIAGGAWVFRPYFTGSAGGLAVGDCFDQPPGTSPVVEDVQHHPCTDPHDAEVIFVGNYEPATDTYPSDDQFLDFAGSRCIPAFGTYTGLVYGDTINLDFSMFYPTIQGWGDGQRKVTCFAYHIDATKFTESIKAK